MDYNHGNNFQNLYKPLEPIIYNDNNNKNNNINNNNIYNFNYNNNDKEFNINNKNNSNYNDNNIFGLNFHQDEEDNENQIINSLHFSKFNMNSQNYINENNNYINEINNNNYNYKAANNIENNFEQKIKNNRNILYNNMNLNHRNAELVQGEEPFQISVSKYSESNLDNHSIFGNSKINNNYNNNNKMAQIKDNKNNDNINEHNLNKNNKIMKKINNQNNQAYNNKFQKPHPNYIKHNLILNNNYYINNNSNITNNKNVPIIVHTKSFSSKKNPVLNKKLNSKTNYNTLNNYYRIPKTKFKPKKENINKNEQNKKNNQIYNTYNNKKNYNINHKKHNSNSNFSVRIHENLNINKLMKNNVFNNINDSFIPKEENFKKIYSKRQKAELDMVRGLYNFDKKFFNFDIKNGTKTVNYIKFIKPTEPILQINYKNVDKFYPLIRKKFINEINVFNANNNSNISKNNSIIPQSEPILNNDNFENIEPISNNIQNLNNLKKSNPTKLVKNRRIKISKINQYNEKQNKKNLTFDFDNQITDNNIIPNTLTDNNVNIPDKDKDGISRLVKKKIYDWLVDIDIIKDKIIKVDSLPTLCINGVLLCDLINRCEGKNEILKGIIRRTNTRSQIQVNINKALEYLRTIEKFPSRNLWNNIEISKGNSVVIWQLLDDIYNFYANKNTFKRRYKKGLNNNMNRTFTRDNTDNPNKLNQLDINDNHYNNDILSKNINSLNRMKDTNNNNIFQNANTNINNNLINHVNQNNYFSKNTYTPEEYKTNIQKRRKILEDNLYKENNEINNNENFIYDNSKKLSKRGKNSNNNLNNINVNNPYRLTNESSNRNNLNHTNDNIYESKMFSMDTSLDNKSNKYSKMNNNNNNKIFPKNLDISSISSDRNFIAQKNNKSFSVNNGVYNKKRQNKNNAGVSRYGNNQSFYSTNLEGNRKRKGCFLLFEKSSINRLKEKIGNFNKYNVDDLDTLDIKDI